MSYKSSKGRDLGKELIVYQSNNVGQGIGAGGDAQIPAVAGIGGTILSDSIDYTNNTRTVVHVFSSPGTFSLSQAVTADYLLVAGGGGGGGGSGGAGPTGGGGGGGGAGGVRLSTNVSFAANDYTIGIGTGSPGGADTNAGTSGNSSTISSPGVSITSPGGGGGGYGSGSGGSTGQPGGSGGGGGSNAGSGSAVPDSDPSRFGFPGGGGQPQGNGGVGGGGGGAGGGGQSGGPPNPSGGLGIGVTWVPAAYGLPGPDAPARYFATGGRGGGYNPSFEAGEYSTGNGGDAAYRGTGKSGGPGIFFIRYTYDFPT